MLKKFPIFFLCLIFGLTLIFPTSGYAEDANNPDKVTETLRLAEIIGVLEMTHISSPERSKLIDNGIEGVIKSLKDPYTTYMTPQSFEQMKNPQIQYAGIGVTLERVTDGLVITEVFEDGPAYEKGIETGDTILKINYVMVKDLPLDKVVEKTRGEEGSVVRLEVKKAHGEIVSVDLVRQKVSLPNIKKQIIANNIGYIKLLTFSEDAGKEFTAAFQDLNTLGMESLIIDLRGNSGGLLESAKEILANFIDKGPIIKIIENNGNLYSEEIEGNRWGKPVIILMNEYSASASEVVAGALQDYKLAKVLGSRSFGKGSMQQTFSLQSGGFLKVTTNKWLTPNERSIDNVGISPDYPVLEPTLQLYRAIEILQKSDALTIRYLPKTQQWLFNEKDTHFFATPKKIKHEMFYPLRFITEAFGYTSVWNGTDKSITLSLNTDTKKILKNKYILVDGIAYIKDKELAKNIDLKINQNEQSLTFTMNK